MNVLVEIENIDFFSTMAGRALDLRKPLWEKVAPIHYRTATQEFDRQGQLGASGFVAWAPFKFKPKGTSRGAGGRFTTRKLLNRTGRLRREVAHQGGVGQATVEIGADFLIFRSHVDYEEYHQHGVPSRGLPARPFARFEDPEAQAEAMRELMAYVVAGVDPAAAERVLRGG